MKKQKKKKQRPTIASSSGEETLVPSEVTRQTGGIWRDLLKGALFAVLVIGIKVAVEHTSIGKQLEVAGYIFLQEQLTSEPGRVQIVDISDLEVSKTSINGRTYHATPRDVLSNLIQAIADQYPTAIGVDIDFSPDSAGYLTPNDPDFFQFCLQRSVPVFLGIHRTQALPPEMWLGDKKYEQLAASIIIPRQDATRMPAAIQTSQSFSSGPTMSAALASSFEKTQCAIGEFLRRAGLAEQTSTREFGQGGNLKDFLVDYGPLDGLMKDRLQTANPAVIRDQGRLLTNKIVLVGDGTLGKGTDTFVIPGRPQPVPGVYLHACAAYTLTEMPLYELNWKGRLAIDVLLVAFVLLPIAVIKLIFRKEQTRRLATGRLQFLLILIVVLAAIGVGVIFVHETCVMWSDFFLAVGALILHPSIERRLQSFGEFIKKTGPQVLRALLFKQDPEERR